MGDRTDVIVRDGNALLDAIDDAIGSSAALRLSISRDRCSRAVDRVLDSACSALGSTQLATDWSNDNLQAELRESLWNVNVARWESGCCDDECDCLTDEIDRVGLQWIEVDELDRRRTHWLQAGVSSHWTVTA